MLSYIQVKFAPGTVITLTCTPGAVTGAIEFVNPNFIVLRKADNTTVGISAADVRSFSTQEEELDVPFVDQTDKSFTPVPSTIHAETNTDEDNEATNKAGSVESAKETTNTLAPLTAAEVEGTVKCKVVGTIPLDRLEQIDPKFKKRNYFKKDAQEEDENDENIAEEPNDYNDSAKKEYRDFVPAMGRITHYNPDKKFGFIRDFANETDLYFNIQQIVDTDVFDQLYKGTKVVYTMDTNNHGNIARCIHLPRLVRDLIPIADDLIDGHRYLPAKSMLSHILAVAPNDPEARELMNEVEEILANDARYNHAAPNQQADFYSTLYSQAKKAYLAKDTDAAIDLYHQALEAGEKEESCIKDLVTLYVSLYKQTDDPKLKEEHRCQAQDFVADYIDRLPENLTTLQFLALNFYLPLNDYPNLILMVDRILDYEPIYKSPSKRAFFIWQKASALSRLGRTDEALTLIDEGLTIVPHHTQLNRLKYFIMNPRTEELAEGEEKQMQSEFSEEKELEEKPANDSDETSEMAEDATESIEEATENCETSKMEEGIPEETEVKENSQEENPVH